ncbi:hypothetical protein D0C36_20110 [Mucilaginibacter conchicola]|uniref:Uncharacterized protein n=1 Tax=Mucilaginibacter conchicola TaxID=2303333 RepID=A0A372NSJ9_9SPHI|nr:hypothetical protein [Mucilaginibacter conchicola]RFZ91243.1 hypothetical protein D0C36_20110 [Mucilaginibacter conchicola]
MTYDLLMQERIDRFGAILNIIPLPGEIPGELLILSAGEQPGLWSYRHLPTKGTTIYFIFRKQGYSDGRPAGWECLDRELNELMKDRSRVNDR